MIANTALSILCNNVLNGLDCIKCQQKYSKKIKRIYNINNLSAMRPYEIQLLEQPLHLYYGDEFLENLGCGKKGKEHYNWFIRVLTNTEVAYQSTTYIHHLLVIQFLFGDIEWFKEY